MSLYDIALIEQDLPGFEVSHFASIASTQKWLMEWSLREELRPHLCLADFQTSGVGRRIGTTWQARPQHAILMSMLLPTTFFDASLPMHILAESLKLLQPFCREIRFKWPNDLILGEEKLGGFLVDVLKSQDKTWVVVGVGINILSAPSGKATLSTTEQLVNVTRLVIDLTRHFYGALQCKNPLPLAFLNACHVLHGKQIELTSMQKSWQGKVERLAEDGGLILKSNGSQRIFYEGHVEKY